MDYVEPFSPPACLDEESFNPLLGDTGPPLTNSAAANSAELGWPYTSQYQLPVSQWEEPCAARLPTCRQQRRRSVPTSAQWQVSEAHQRSSRHVSVQCVGSSWLIAGYMCTWHLLQSHNLLPFTGRQPPGWEAQVSG